MAAIYLDNLVKPRQSKAPTTVLAYEPIPTQYTYTDLHLDLAFAKNIGNGWNAVNSKDIEVDYDQKAVANSIRNILTTRPGWKVLTPTFGCRLDTFLFEPLTEFNAHNIANLVLRSIENFEPRIEITSIDIAPLYDELMYHIEINYKLKQAGLLNTLQLKFNTQALSLNDIIIL
jgi:phage baseplate assembly protein W